MTSISPEPSSRDSADGLNSVVNLLQEWLPKFSSIEEMVQDLHERVPLPSIQTDIDEILDIRIVIHHQDDDKAVRNIGEEGIRVKIHNLEGAFKFVETVRYLPRATTPNGKTPPSSMLLTVKGFAAEQAIRGGMPRVLRILGLSDKCQALPRRWTVHVKGFSKDEDKGAFPDWTAFFAHHTGLNNLDAKFAFSRLLLETFSMDTAVDICRTGIRIGMVRYKVEYVAPTPSLNTNLLTLNTRPFSPQGTPLFCHACNNPGHFKTACGFGKLQCGKCAEEHDTRECPPGSTIKCCNCEGDHMAWDFRCKDQKSKREHAKAAAHRKVGPFWKEWPLTWSKPRRKRRAEEDDDDSTSRKRPKTGAPSLPRAANSGSRGSNRNKPPFAGKSRGRPSGLQQASQDPLQKTLSWNLHAAPFTPSTSQVAAPQSASSVTPDKGASNVEDAASQDCGVVQQVQSNDEATTSSHSNTPSVTPVTPEALDNTRQSGATRPDDLTEYEQPLERQHGWTTNEESDQEESGQEESGQEESGEGEYSEEDSSVQHSIPSSPYSF
ncbi:hypothetical protein FDECE_13758 [Fusarium decemcellulare]|nr:hypothetical protein FDECE_13758 [Fusarium decemcellulare]